MRTLTIISLILVVIGALNWLLVGLFNYDLVAAIFSAAPAWARLVYILVGLAGVFGIFVIGKLIESKEDVCVPGHMMGMPGQTR